MYPSSASFATDQQALVSHTLHPFVGSLAFAGSLARLSSLKFMVESGSGAYLCVNTYATFAERPLCLRSKLQAALKQLAVELVSDLISANSNM